MSSPAEPDFRRRALVSARFVVFLVVAGISGALSVVCLCGFAGFELMARLGFRGFVFGVLYGLFYVYKKKWVLEFPIIQVSDWLSCFFFFCYVCFVDKVLFLIFELDCY